MKEYKLIDAVSKVYLTSDLSSEIQNGFFFSSENN